MPYPLNHVAYDCKLESNRDDSHDAIYTALQERERKELMDGNGWDPAKNVAAVILRKGSRTCTGVSFSRARGQSDVDGHSEKEALIIAIETAIEDGLLSRKNPYPSKDEDKRNYFLSYRDQLKNLNFTLFTERKPCEPSKNTNAYSCSTLLDDLLDDPSKHKVYYAIPSGNPHQEKRTLRAVLSYACRTLGAGNLGPPLVTSHVKDLPRDWQPTVSSNDDVVPIIEDAWVKEEFQRISGNRCPPTTSPVAAPLAPESTSTSSSSMSTTVEASVSHPAQPTSFTSPMASALVEPAQPRSSPPPITHMFNARRSSMKRASPETSEQSDTTRGSSEKKQKPNIPSSQSPPSPPRP